MSYTVSNIKTELAGVLHGTTVNSVNGLDALISRAARTFVNDIDPQEMIRIEQLDSPLYDKVWNYMCPTDLKDDRIVDIRPQVNREVWDRFFQIYNMDFDLFKSKLANNAAFTVQWDHGVKTLRIAKNLTAAQQVNPVNTISDTGTWAVGGTASDLAQDNLVYVAAGSSLRFNAAAGPNTSDAYLENSTQPSVDISRDENQGSLFAWVYIPDPNSAVSFTLRWGSSSGDYWSKTVTTAQDATVFQTGWNLLRFPWSSATTTGSPDSTDITYLRFTVTYDGTLTEDWRLNEITSQLGSIYEIEYYSKYLFRDSSTGAWQESVTADSNIVNLDTSSYNVFFALVCYYCAQQIQGANSSFDAQFWRDEYEKQKARYVAKIRSQIIQPQTQYYTMPPKKSGQSRIRNAT